MRRTPVALSTILAAVTVLAILLALPSVSQAGPVDPPPASFASVAATVRAAVIMVRTPPLELFSPSEPPDEGEDCEEGNEVCAERESFREFLEAFLRALRARTLCSGVIVDPSGLVVTSARAVRLAKDFEVVMTDGTPVAAIIVGLDLRTDIAVLKLSNGQGLYPSLPFGDSDRVRMGDWVLAAGAPHGLAGSVTAGVVSATPQAASASVVAAYLATDAVLGRGAAGGPIVNLAGEIVGIATVLGVDGVGYALPSRTVQAVFLELLEKGYVSRPWLGATTQSLTPELARALGARDATGVLVSDVAPEGPAARAGLRSGDILIELDRTKIASRAQLDRAVAGLKPGRSVTVRVRREARDVTATVRLGEEPDEWRLPPAQARAKDLIGIEVRPLTPDMGVVAVSIEPGSPADGGGIERGDIIREINRHPVRRIGDFETAVRNLKAGAQVLMLVQRGDVAVYVVITAAR